MDPVWSSRAFYGGPNGPNHGSPRGLLDIDGWQSMDPGAAAQAVQVSAYPDRYAVNQPIAEKVLSALSGVSLSSDLECAQPAGDLPANLPPGFPGDSHHGGRLAARQAVRLGRRRLQRTDRRRIRLLRPRPLRRVPSLRRPDPTPPLLRRPDPRRHRHPLGRQAARRPDLLQLPRRRRPAPRRDLRRRRPDPACATDRRCRPLRDDRRVRRRGHDRPPSGLQVAIQLSETDATPPGHAAEPRASASDACLVEDRLARRALHLVRALGLNRVGVADRAAVSLSHGFSLFERWESPTGLALQHFAQSLNQTSRKMAL